jgi:hypothetical protein
VASKTAKFDHRTNLIKNNHLQHNFLLTCHTHTTKSQGLIALINITQCTLLSKLTMQSWQILLQTSGLFGNIHLIPKHE